ncbi:Hypothetical protein R9X50_00306600 [Acrodontium crateriforme]|uniref:Alanyl-transfer RNA synthetases family profile domain-containing protein n=1 Tax=Acrodontium crateriforme TaxID=150365 RepID=A0AAQ3M2T4_9PEZI|nr:Hypothetical protein R9X50_00306600 [Acrodontium crateriforme]
MQKTLYRPVVPLARRYCGLFHLYNHPPCIPLDPTFSQRHWLSIMSVQDNHPPPTKAIFQYDESIRKHIASITSMRRYEVLPETEKSLFKQAIADTWAVETNETIFYAQGGGQPFDTGYMSPVDANQKEIKFIVDAVRSGVEGVGRIIHFGHFDEDGSSLAMGDMIQQHIDGARRDLNSRIHTAGHTVSLAVRRLAETTPDLNVTDGFKAQHYPDVAYVDFQGTIDPKFKYAIYDQSNKFVRDALPINVYWCKPDELEKNDVIAIEGMPVIAGFDGKTRIVDIVGAGAYPCGGTHVPDTSLVGEIKIKSMKTKKGITKIAYEVAP